MRAALQLFLFVTLAVSLIVAAALLLAIDRQPLIHRAAEITPESIGRAKRILDANNPRRLRTGEQRTIFVSDGDLDLAANYLTQQYTGGSARLILHDRNAQITASVPVRKGPIRIYINVDAVLAEAAPQPSIKRLRLGRLPLPRWLADWLLQKAIIHAIGEEAFHAGTAAVKKIDIRDRRVAITYQWHADLKENIRSALLAPEDRERLEVYQRRLSEAARAVSSPNMALTELLSPIFKLAQERSRNDDPLAENRAAILILTFYINHQSPQALLPEARTWPEPVARTITLNGREDLSKHFMTSAALAAKAGGVLADAAGVYKEVADSRGGSGFSFADIAADRAGTRFGEEAVQSTESARKLQQRVRAAIVDRDVIPMTEDLPEYMSEAEFKRRFGGVDAIAYKQLLSEIERRVAAVSLYR
jgi:hypothetical protein